MRRSHSHHENHSPDNGREDIRRETTLTNHNDSQVIPRLPKGFRDFTPDDLLVRRQIFETIRGVYERYGFQPYETPAVEYVDVLGKFLPESDQPDGGIFSFRDDAEDWIALRYDLTAPLARLFSQYPNLPKPFRRYQVSPVWRVEKPGPGRFREFYQFDIDTVGSPSMAADAEVCAVLCDAFSALGLATGEYVVVINNRKVVNGVLEAAGIEALDASNNLSIKALRVMRAIDKVDRLGVDGVIPLLGKGRKDESGDFTEGSDLTPAQIDRVVQYLNATGSTRKAFCDTLLPLMANSATGLQGIKELQEIDQLLHVAGYDETKVKCDASIVRGLEYYTGPVFEVRLTFEITDEKGEKKQFGSVGGGGRYDTLVKRFTGQEVPATGASIGPDRLQAALQMLGKFKKTTSNKPVLVTVMDKSRLEEYQKITFELRRAGISAEMYLGGGGFRQQLKYADQRDLIAVIIAGSNEFDQGQLTIKDLKLGKVLAEEVTDRQQWLKSQPAQITISRGELLPKVREILQRYA